MFNLQEYIMREALIISILYFILNIIYDVESFYKIIFYMYVISIIFKSISLYGERINDEHMTNLYLRFYEYVNITIYISIYVNILYLISNEFTISTEHIYNEI